MTRLVLTEQATADLAGLEANPAECSRLRKTRKTLGLLQTNRRHPGLNVHKLQSISQKMPNGATVDLWEAYVENNTPGAWRVFYHLGTKDTITVVAIQPHL